MPTKEHCIVFCTLPDAAAAERLAGALVERGLAACVNIVPGLTSVYRWKGRIERDSEVLAIIKTRSDALPRLKEAIPALHPYELPEIVAVPITDGLPAYLAWIDDNLKGTS